MEALDQAELEAKKVIEEAITNIENIKTEEDAKIQIINRLLTNVLGWPHSHIKAETKHENGFSDYLLCERESPVLLIEAKQIGLLTVDTAEKNKVRHLKISGSALKATLAGINQAASYSLTEGIPVAVLTDGVAWIIFKTFVQGTSYKEKEAIVFPSFNAVISNFSLFYDLLSREQLGKRIYNSIFDGIHNSRSFLSQELVSPLKDNDIVLSKKSDIAFDLEKIFSNFFSRLTGEDDEDLLIECFVESRESRIADFSLEKITRNVLGNIAPYEKDVDSQLANLIESSVGIEELSSDSGQTIFIVGPTGAGKSTFLDRFFRKTLPDTIRSKCILMNVNCLDATGREDTALAWLTESFISCLEKEIYQDGIPSWNDLLGLYHIEYKRRAQGVDAQLYARDKDSFKEKFSNFLDEKVENDREEYLRKILSDVVKNRKLLPILVVDNTDEFSIEFKQILFQFSQALRRHCNHCLVLFPVTDKSAWSFSKTDIFGIYRSRSFFLPTPSPREVFRKRIDFLKKKLIDESADRKSKNNYLSKKGISITIENLDGFAHVLESIFVDHDFTSKTIGELTNYNIRRTLALSQRVITSPIIKIEDLIKSYVVGQFVATNFSKFIDALIRGDYEAYRYDDNHEIYPIFQISSDYRYSPLLKIRILAFLDAIYRSGRTVEEKHSSVESIINYFDALGGSEIAVEICLSALLEAGLIEPYDVSNRNLSHGQKFAISYRGIAHLRLAIHNSVFFYQMAITTAIADKDVAYQIASLYKSRSPFVQKADAIKKLFLEYLFKEDEFFFSVKVEAPQYDCQKHILVELKRFSSTSANQKNDPSSILGDEFKEGAVIKDVTVTVDFYDSDKGFGFAEADGDNTRVYIPANKLEEFGWEGLKDGDSLVCDLSRTTRGLDIIRIHEVHTNEESFENVDCQIIRLFSDRGYGFVKMNDSSRTAFFHISVFDVNVRDKIFEGKQLSAEIGPDKKGDGYIVKRIISIH